MRPYTAINLGPAVESLLASVPHLLVMAVLVVASAFFSGSEAALFYLTREQREQLAAGGRGARAAVALLTDAPRVLTTILFWNLLVNMAFFALSSLVTLRLGEALGPKGSTAMVVGSLLAIILFGEMLPKNIAVIWPRPVAILAGLPLTVAARIVDPVLPVLRMVTNASLRLVAPTFVPEPYLELGDLERAIALGASDRALLEQERDILSRTVALSEMRVEEIMRPRKRYWAFTPPVHIEDLEGEETPSGYVLVTEPDSEEIAAALPLDRVAMTPIDSLHLYAQPVAYVPWSAPAAAALDVLQTTGRRVAAVLNEMGETVGVVTLEDLFDYLLNPESHEHEPVRQLARIRSLGDDAWEVSGLTSLRAVSRRIGATLPEAQNVTVGGLLQEVLHRVPVAADAIAWGGLRWEVIDAPEEGPMVIRLRPATDDFTAPSDTEGLS